LPEKRSLSTPWRISDYYLKTTAKERLINSIIVIPYMVSSRFARLCVVADRDRIASVYSACYGGAIPLASMKCARIVLIGVTAS
jgi:hypothetical protein